MKVSVNKSCLNKQNPQLVAKGWKNVFVDLDWLLKWVASGYGWSATHFIDRHRKAENVDGSNMIVLDFDGDTSLANFWATHTAKTWCAATYTSASHTPAMNRFRAIFPLERELHSAAEHKGAYWLIVNRLLADLGLDKLADNCGQKAERLWYGNTNTTLVRHDGNCVPAFLLEDIAYQEVTDFVKSDVTSIDIERCQWLLTSFLRPSDDGEYESYYLPIMAACAGVGQPLFDTWTEWVLSGHHGAKPENVMPFKWKGLGNYAGHTTLYSYAKKQDPDWTKKLPANLRFSSTGSAAGYNEQDPIVELEQVITPTIQNTPNVIDFPEPTPDSDLAPKTRGRKKKSNSDAAQEREHDVKQVQDILPGLRRNELTGAIEYTNNVGTERELQGNDLDLMTTRVACEHGIFIPESRIKSAIQYAASINSYCPIRRYIDKCATTATPHPEWDNIGKVFLGNDHQLATTAMQRMMIGAVARAMNPGCSMSWLPILVGAQGVGKSMFARSLVPERLFSEVTTPLDTLMKEQYRLHVAWLLELPEIDNYFNTRNIENFKNLITTRMDEVRRPYASLPERLQRRFVLIGTTNRNQFLIDSTGNRRFVPLEIGANFLIPWKRISEERDQLWAAAVQAYRNHDAFEFNSGEIAAIAEYIQEFGDPDPWMEKIGFYVNTREEVTAAEVLTAALELDPRAQGRREGRRAADCLQAMGWRRKSTTRKDAVTGKRRSVRLWIRPEDDPLKEEHILNDF